MLRACLPLLACAMVAAAGCGEKTYHGDQGQAVNAVKQWRSAEDHADYHRACFALITRHFAEVIGGGRKECEDAERRRSDKGSPLKSASDPRVRGKRARVAVSYDDGTKGDVVLEKSGGRWRVDRLDYTSIGD